MKASKRMVARLFTIKNLSMKRLFLLLLMPLFSMMAVADEAINSLVVWAKDGTKVAYALADKPKVTFTGTDLVITSNGIEVNYALENMSRFTYENSTSTGVTNLKNGETSLKLDKESLQFPSLKANSTLTVYSANGTLVFKQIVRKDGEYSFPISNLNTGVYMVNVNGLTYKIVKR